MRFPKPILTWTEPKAWTRQRRATSEQEWVRSPFFRPLAAGAIFTILVTQPLLSPLAATIDRPAWLDGLVACLFACTLVYALPWLQARLLPAYVSIFAEGVRVVEGAACSWIRRERIVRAHVETTSGEAVLAVESPAGRVRRYGLGAGTTPAAVARALAELGLRSKR